MIVCMQVLFIRERMSLVFTVYHQMKKVVRIKVVQYCSILKERRVAVNVPITPYPCEKVTPLLIF